MKLKTGNLKELFWGKSGTTAVGTVWMAVCVQGLVAVQIGGKQEAFTRGLATRYGILPIYREDQIAPMKQEIEAYLLGERKIFEFPIHWGVTSAFQQKVLQAVCAIPYGETRSYGQIAGQIGMPQAPRAVGRANATNPMPLVIPCHRLVGADGSLRGYGGGQGLLTKAWLLNLERGHLTF